MAPSTKQTPWRATKWGAAPTIGSDAEARRVLELVEAIKHDKDCNKIKNLYREVMQQQEFDECVAGRIVPDGRPYPWQADFHNAGAIYDHRAVIATNQGGKTRSCAAEVSSHATGWYPNWWKGRRFTEPVKVCLGSNTNETLRDPVQLELFGDFEAESRIPDGKGWLPKSSILNVTYRQCGLAGIFDEVQVRHASGGISSIKQKTYEQGWTKWQGTQFDIYWLDEEPENDDRLFSEVLRGLLVRNGILLFSRTPLFGQTQIIRHFMQDGKKTTYYKNVTIDECPHMSDKKKQEFIDDIPPHEVDCRTKGIPMLGEGAIYPVADDLIEIEPFPLPSYYRYICGMDFGDDHPTAAVWCAHDPDSDILYIYDCYRKRRDTVANHASAITTRGIWIPMSWPHDGMAKDRAGSGVNLRDLYKANHVNMLTLSARYKDDKAGSQARAPIIQTCYQRMVDGRLRVFKHLTPWFEEKRMYHRKDGKVVDQNDDLMSAMHYAVMMIRYARSHYQRPQQENALTVDPLQEFTLV